MTQRTNSMTAILIQRAAYYRRFFALAAPFCFGHARVVDLVRQLPRTQKIDGFQMKRCLGFPASVRTKKRTRHPLATIRRWRSEQCAIANLVNPPETAHANHNVSILPQCRESYA